MKRIIVEYKKLNDEILNLLSIKFPYGYDDDDIITFENTLGEEIEAVEVRTDDIIYLVKIGKRLQKAMKDYDDEAEIKIDEEVQVPVEDEEENFEYDSDDDITEENDIEFDQD